MTKMCIGDQQAVPSVRMLRHVTAKGEFAQLSTLKSVRNKYSASLTVG